jgi:hypothetical protein
MPNVFSAEQAVVNGPSFGNAPANRVKANRLNGRIRIFMATVTVPAGTLVGERIFWGKLPVGARPIGHLGRLEWSAGAASSTLNLGDNVSAARHLAATAITTAGSAVPAAATAGGAQFETTEDSNSVANAFLSTTDNCTLVSTVAGATLQTGQVITLTMPYVQD